MTTNITDILYEALLEASNIFDNYPDIAKEYVGTYEVVRNAINSYHSSRETQQPVDPLAGTPDGLVEGVEFTK